MVHAQRVLDELKKNRVTHVIGLPDNSSVGLFELLRQDRDIRLVSVTREGEAFAIAAGLWIGGSVPVVLIQNTGFCESGDGFRGTITRMRVPLLSLITFRGYAKMMRWRVDEPGASADEEALSRAQLDSAALVTEPTLNAWGVPYDFIHGEDDVPKISDAFLKTAESDWPFALLVTCDLG